MLGLGSRISPISRLIEKCPVGSNHRSVDRVILFLVGNYPRTFDSSAGQEPPGTQSEDNPFYYPEKVYEHITCTGPSQSYVNTERESVSGEYGQCQPGSFGPYPGTDIVPSPSPSRQFSSDKNGDPRAMLQSTASSIASHASLNEAYGLMQPVATIGSHPWLRDSLTNTGDMEAGNMEPSQNVKLPKRG